MGRLGWTGMFTVWGWTLWTVLRTDDIYRLDIYDGTGVINVIKGVAGADVEDWRHPR